MSVNVNGSAKAEFARLDAEILALTTKLNDMQQELRASFCLMWGITPGVTRVRLVVCKHSMMLAKNLRHHVGTEQTFLVKSCGIRRPYAPDAAWPTPWITIYGVNQDGTDSLREFHIYDCWEHAE